PRVLPEVDDAQRGLVAEPEQQSEHDQHAEPEPGNRDEENGRRARDVVGDAVRSERAHDADGETDDPRDQHREGPDLGAPRAAVDDEIADAVTAKERFTE